MPALHTPPLQVWLHEQHALSEQVAPSVVHMPPLTQGVLPPVPPSAPVPPNPPVPPSAPVPPNAPVLPELPKPPVPPVEVVPPVDVVPPLPPRVPPVAPEPPWPELPPVVPLPPDSDIPAIPPASTCETLVPPQAAANTKIDAVKAALEARSVGIMNRDLAISVPASLCHRCHEHLHSAAAPRLSAWIQANTGSSLVTRAVSSEPLASGSDQLEGGGADSQAPATGATFFPSRNVAGR